MFCPAAKNCCYEWLQAVNSKELYANHLNHLPVFL